MQVLFDADKIQSQDEEAKAVRNKALFHYRQVILNAFREVNDQLVIYQKSRQLTTEHEKQVKILSAICISPNYVMKKARSIT